jgi:PncC family amidohydrolase
VLGGVAYSDDTKVAQVDVEREAIERYGAVSEQVSKELAQGEREQLEASVGVRVTGIAGPDGGSEEKRVGLVWFSVAVGEDQSLTLGQESETVSYFFLT